MTARIVMLVLAVTMLPAQSGADVAGTGTFDIFATADGGLDFDGAITFDGGMRSVLGRQVNLARDIGTMTYDGEVLGEPSAMTAIFTLEADADETDVSFAAGGSASCVTPACIGGRSTLAGRLEVLSDDEGALPDGAFTFDGTIDIDELGEGFGTFAINAFPLLTTPVGSGVEVANGVQTYFDSLANATRIFAARAVFSEVQSEGVTSFVALSAFSGALPPGIGLDPAVSVFVDVQTTALFDGGLRVCLAFADEDGDGVVDGTDIEASGLRLLHAENVGAPLADVTSAPSEGEVCGDLTATGTVVVGVAAVGGGTTTTTVVAGGGTTTSTVVGGETTTTSTVVVGPVTTTSSSLPIGASTTTSSTVSGGSSTTTSTTLGGASTSTTVAVPGSTSTTCSTSATSTTSTVTPTTVPAPPPTSTTTSTFALASTTTSTVPVCATALECLDELIAGPLCPGESLNQKLATLIHKKLAKAQRGLVRARTASDGKDAGRLLRKARKQLDRIDRKAEAFLSKRRKPISAQCRDRIRAALAQVAQQIEAQRL